MTKKEIKIKIKELENKIKDLYSYPIHIPEYQNLIDRANQLKFKYLELSFIVSTVSSQSSLVSKVIGMGSSSLVYSSFESCPRNAIAST
jgi:hypothetical protein